MVTSTAPRPRVNAKSRPLNVSLLLTIRETDYAVTVIAPGPDNVKAYRLEKLSGDRETYDVAHTNDGLVVCDCPSYVASHEGTSSTCKHGSALVLMGLLPKPCCVANTRAAYDDARERAAAVAPTPDEPTAPAPYAEHVAKLAAIAEAEAEVRSEAERPAPVVKAPIHPTTYDPQWQAALAAVSKGEAIWIDHRAFYTSDPLPAPAKGIASGNIPDEPRLIDDDGTPFETPAEMDARHRAEHAAAAAGLMEGNPFLPACCPDDEVLPCRACVAHEGPADLSDDEWDDSHVWAPSDFLPDADEPDDEPPARSLADQVLDHARSLRAEGSPLGDLLAERAEQLAAEIRYLGASTVEQYRDRREAALDGARDAAEARCC